jgi:hypothetical protein
MCVQVRSTLSVDGLGAVDTRKRPEFWGQILTLNTACWLSVGSVAQVCSVGNVFARLFLSSHSMTRQYICIPQPTGIERVVRCPGSLETLFRTESSVKNLAEVFHALAHMLVQLLPVIGRAASCQSVLQLIGANLASFLQSIHLQLLARTAYVCDSSLRFPCTVLPYLSSLL